MPGDGFRPRNCVGCKVNDMFWKYHPCPYVHKLIYTRTNITKLCADIQIHTYIYFFYIYIPIFSSSSIPTKKGIPPGKTWICWKWRWIFPIGKSSKTGGIYRNHLQLAGTTPPWAPRCFPPRWRHISWPGLGHDIMYESMNGSWLRRGCDGFVHVPKNVHCHICHSHGEVGEKKLDPDSPDRRQAHFRWFHLGSMAKHRALGGFRHSLWLRAAISYG